MIAAARRTTWTAVLCVLLISSQLTATTIVPMSIERLTSASTNVVLGEAADSWVQWNAEHTMIYTVTRFRVERSLKGEAGQTILVKQMGGASEGYQQKVAGVRLFQEGERDVLFLHPAATPDDRYVVTGLMQGNFAVKSTDADPIVSNGVPGVEAFDPASKKTSAYHGAEMRLSQLEARVKGAAAL